MWLSEKQAKKATRGKQPHQFLPLVVAEEVRQDELLESTATSWEVSRCSPL